MSAIDSGKSLLRRRMREQRSVVSPRMRVEESGMICAWLMRPEPLHLESARTVGMYWPLPWEVDLRPLMRWLRTMGVEVVLPAFDEESGRYRPASAPADEKLLLPGRQGILEPDPKKWVKSTNIDFWLVPGLAFDWDGNRLGHGGGWFDRLLEPAGKACLCGVAYSWEMVDSVPREQHDIQMTWMVTDKGVFRAPRLVGGGRH